MAACMRPLKMAKSKYQTHSIVRNKCTVTTASGRRWRRWKYRDEAASRNMSMSRRRNDGIKRRRRRARKKAGGPAPLASRGNVRRRPGASKMAIVGDAHCRGISPRLHHVRRASRRAGGRASRAAHRMRGQSSSATGHKGKKCRGRRW